MVFIAGRLFLLGEVRFPKHLIFQQIEEILAGGNSKIFWNVYPDPWLGGGFRHSLFSPLLGEMIQFDEHIFQMG